MISHWQGVRLTGRFLACILRDVRVVLVIAAGSAVEAGVGRGGDGGER